MTHDPLCPVRTERQGSASTDPSVPTVDYRPAVPCVCDLLAKADARATARTLDKARNAVAALIHNNMCDCESCWWKADALDAVNALRGES